MHSNDSLNSLRTGLVGEWWWLKHPFVHSKDSLGQGIDGDDDCRKQVTLIINVDHYVAA